MSEYKLKTPRQAEAVVGAYHKVEDGEAPPAGEE